LSNILTPRSKSLYSFNDDDDNGDDDADNDDDDDDDDDNSDDDGNSIDDRPNRNVNLSEKDCLTMSGHTNNAFT